MPEAIEALWCSHCDRFCLAQGARACRCSGPIEMGNAVTKVVYGTHVVCGDCAAPLPADQLGDLLAPLVEGPEA